MKALTKIVLGTIALSGIFFPCSAHLPSINSTQFINGPTGFGYKGNISRATVEYKNRGEWSGTTEYRGDYSVTKGDTVSCGEFNGKKLWWWAKFYAKGDELKPGYFAPQGGTSPWVLINSLSAVASGKVNYTWHGWNGEMQSMTGLDAKIPTWRDGAEGAYSFTHDDIGAMPFDLSIKPAWELTKNYPDIKTCWGVFAGAEAMSGQTWDLARDMVLEGHEMFNHSMKHTSAADQWQWFKPGQKIPSHDPAIPEAIRGLTVVGTWGDPAAEPVYPYVGDGTRVFASPLVSIKSTHYWTQNAPTSEVPGTNLGAPYGTVIEPVITAKYGVEEITLPSGQKQYVKYTKKDTTGEGLNEGYIAAVGPTWLELTDLDNYGSLPQYGGSGTGYWQSATSAAPKEWKWDIYTSIKLGEIVSYNGSYFKALVEAPGMAPTTTPDWTGKASWATASFTATDVDAALKDTNGTYTGRCWTSTTKYVADDKGAPGFVAKIFCVKAWEPADFKLNIQDASDLINQNIYERIITAGEHFRKGKKSEYYGYPFDAYSEVTHDSLEQNGFVGARGGAKSGRPIPGDFFHPYRIDFDAFYITKTDWSPTKTGKGYTYPDNPHVLLGLNEMVDKIIETKGYMIREFHSVPDIDGASWYSDEPSEQWPINSAAQGVGGWWGGITKNMLKEHYDYLQTKIDARKITVYTVGEVTKYRMTANATSGATIAKDGTNYTLTCTTTEDILEKYRDEITVMVSLDQAVDSLGVDYKTVNPDWGMSPRRKPRNMDGAGKIWSVSINPFLGAATIVPNGAWNGQGTETNGVGIGKGAITKSGITAGFVGISNTGEINLRLPEGYYSVELFTTTGRKVGSSIVNSTMGVITTGIRTNQLGAGIYYLNVTSKGARVMPTTKIIVK